MTQQPQQLLEGLPVCPECGSATFWNNTDGYQTIFCIDDDCKWKQQIRSRPAPSPEPIDSTKGMEQKSETKSPDGRYHLCRSDASRHTCINVDEIRKEAAAQAREEVLDEMQKGESKTSYVWRKAESLRHQEARR